MTSQLHFAAQNDLQNLHLLKANDFANAEPNAQSICECKPKCVQHFANVKSNARAFVIFFRKEKGIPA